MENVVFYRDININQKVSISKNHTYTLSEKSAKGVLFNNFKDLLFQKFFRKNLPFTFDGE